MSSDHTDKERFLFRLKTFQGRIICHLARGWGLSAPTEVQRPPQQGRFSNPSQPFIPLQPPEFAPWSLKQIAQRRESCSNSTASTNSLGWVTQQNCWLTQQNCWLGNLKSLHFVPRIKNLKPLHFFPWVKNLKSLHFFFPSFYADQTSN